MKKENIILLLGSLFIALRLFFPVLQCSYDSDTLCSKGQIIFFTFQQPVENYIIHEIRTYTQAVAIAIITFALYTIIRKPKKIENEPKDSVGLNNRFDKNKNNSPKKSGNYSTQEEFTTALQQKLGSLGITVKQKTVQPESPNKFLVKFVNQKKKPEDKPKE